MNNLGKLEYHNEISFYIGDDLKLKGEILIDNKSYCEGIVSDSDNNNNKYFIFGTFVKNNYLELYLVMNGDIKFKYSATKGYLKYNGKCLNTDSEATIDFYLKVRSLNVDPRDCGKNNPMYVFDSKLKEFKESFIQSNKRSGIIEEFNINNKGR